MNIKVTLKRTIFFRWYCSYLEYRRKRHLDMMSALLKKEGAITLRMFADALNHAAIDFWIDYGTLLGYRRDNDFLEHDSDIDTGAFIEDADAIREVALSWFATILHLTGSFESIVIAGSVLI